MSPRTCSHCLAPISPLARADARYCSTRCRVAAHRERHAPAPIPAELRERARWIRHRSKRPLTVDDRPASSTDPGTWSTFESACASAIGDGLGFVLNGDGIVCLDLDDCVTAGRLEPWAAEVLERVPATYVELSPSGRGLHVWGVGNVPRGRILRLVSGGQIEVYGSGRYLTITGERFGEAPAKLGRLDDLLAALWL